MAGAIQEMHPQPDPSWYCHLRDGTTAFRLLADDGRPEPALVAERERLLADLAAAIHATAWRLQEPELRALEQCIAIQRWRRYGERGAAAEEFKSR